MSDLTPALLRPCPNVRPDPGCARWQGDGTAKKKATLRWLFSSFLAETVSANPTAVIVRECPQVVDFNREYQVTLFASVRLDALQSIPSSGVGTGVGFGKDS